MEGLDYLGAATPDAKVRAAQEALNAAGFDTKGVDGLMGPNTAAAISAFWASRGLSHAAVVDNDLVRALSVTTPTAPAKAPQSTALVPASQSPAAPQEAAPENSKLKKYLLLGAGVAVVIASIGVLYYSGEI